MKPTELDEARMGVLANDVFDCATRFIEQCKAADIPFEHCANMCMSAFANAFGARMACFEDTLKKGGFLPLDFEGQITELKVGMRAGYDDFLAQQQDPVVVQQPAVNDDFQPGPPNPKSPWAP